MVTIKKALKPTYSSQLLFCLNKNTEYQLEGSKTTDRNTVGTETEKGLHYGANDCKSTTENGHF